MSQIIRIKGQDWSGQGRPRVVPDFEYAVPDLTALYRFDRLESGGIPDATGNGHTATGFAGTIDAEGGIFAAQSADTGIVASPVMTLFLVAKLDGSITTNYHMLLSAYQPCSQLYVSNTGQLRAICGLRNTSTGAAAADNSTDIPLASVAGRYVFMCATFDSTRYTLDVPQINYAFSKNISAGFELHPNTAGITTKIGAQGSTNANKLTGRIALAGVINGRAANAVERTALYAAARNQMLSRGIALS